MRKIPQQFFRRVNQSYQFCNVLDTKISKEEWIQKEKQWNEIAKQKNAEQLTNILQSLNEHEIKRVQIIADALANLSMIEFQALFSKVNEFQNKTMGVGVAEINSQWPAIKATEFPSWPPQSKEDLDKAVNALWDGKTMEDFKQLFGGVGGGFGAGGAPSQTAAKAEAKTQQAEQKEEAKKDQEKANYDIELTAFDPAKKINIIKEVRQLFNLGLKDAKDLVEKAPCTLQKQAKTVDAKALKEKLEGIGCTIKLL